jgi:iron complex outermembrane receptor protein
VFDKRFVATCDDPYECYPGVRRTLLGSVKYSW